MVKQEYLIEGMTCGSCAIKIEKAVKTLPNVLEAHVSFKTRSLILSSEIGIDEKELVRVLSTLGQYRLKNGNEAGESPIYSILVWGLGGGLIISIIFYLIQALGMQSFETPFEFILENWYLVLPLIIGFAIQAGLFRAIHLHTRHGGGCTMTTSGGISSTAMLTCCLHNLVPLFPILGASGLAVFFATYQIQVFMLSIGITTLATVYMIKKYYSIKNTTDR